MLRGLLVRQVFLVVDLTLAALMVFVAYMVIAKALSVAPGPSGGGEPVPSQDLSGLFTESGLGQRSEYDALASSRMFGGAGQKTGDAVAAAEPAPVNPTVMKAPPSLRLWGTTAGTAHPSAIIENAAAREVDKTHTYFLDEKVTESHVLKEVHPRRVILFNSAKNQNEVLDMDEVDEAMLASAGSGPRQVRVSSRQSSSGAAHLKRARVEREMREQGAELIRQANPQMYRDENGNVAGITSDNLSNIPLARDAGLKSGDVITSVNGVKIDSEERIAEIFRRFERSSSFNLQVLRGGNTQSINIRLE